MRLTLERLSKQFKNRIAVENVNAELTEGIYGFLGANGAGKTTLMQMICGIVAPTSGEVKLNGKNVTEMGEQFRDLLGYLPQEFGYTPGFTAEDFMLYIASVKGLDPRYARRRTRELMKLVSLEGDMKRKIRTFSGGMKRRLGIAQALLNDPKILIMDEPTAGLDPKERAYFRNVIAEMAQDKIIIISTHIVSDIEYISDQVILMKKGRFILQGTTEELTAEAEGMVWSCQVPVREWAAFENSHTVVNSRNLGELVEARVISPERPCADAEQAEPTLEDLYLKCFSDELGMLEQSSGKKRRGRS
ncbi:ABC transporter ATP-binding protein [Lachnoclostridium sp. An76]|uniref:ABC transporter ATP-binding protein n=1 Tax=Lachnoclostridium sp. An76 TaxID=1965654 RepID=UPI000B3AA14A|nr:ABC transporter ATP-binding protein [Lachnoclostridium sp. An76]OUN35851.1 ABC transporter ATP-binding protein [Lachnoclostridium sp. An76]